MKENFDRAALFVLKQEVLPGHEDDGSLHTDPADPGGTTRFGISQRAYPDVDLKTLDRAGAMKIYQKIWDDAGCNELLWPIDLVIFDTAFNMGKVRAQKLWAMSHGIEDFLFNRQLAYYFMKPLYFRTWIKRTLNLWQEVTK